MSRVFPTFEAFEQAFAAAQVTVRENVIIDGKTYSRTNHYVTPTGDYVVLIEAEDGTGLHLKWSQRGPLLVPTGLTTESQLPSLLDESCTTPGATCAILEHRASVGGVMLQVDIDETLTQPRLYLSESQLDVSQKDPDSSLPHMARLTLNDHTVYVYEHNGSLTLPTVIVETANGTVLHNVVVEVSSSECPHLSLPPHLLVPHS